MVVMISASLIALLMGIYFLVQASADIRDEWFALLQGVVLILIAIFTLAFQVSSPAIYVLIAFVVLIRVLYWFLCFSEVFGGN